MDKFQINKINIVLVSKYMGIRVNSNMETISTLLKYLVKNNQSMYQVKYEKWIYRIHILKVEQIELPYGLGVEYQRKIEGNNNIFSLRKQKADSITNSVENDLVKLKKKKFEENLDLQVAQVCHNCTMW